MSSRPLLLKVSVTNCTTTITRIYVLKATVIKVSVYNSTTTITQMYVLKATVIKVSVYISTTNITRIYVPKNTLIQCVSFQQYYYYHMNGCSQGSCYQKCQSPILIPLSHQCMFSRPLLLKVSVYNSTTTITQMYVLKATVIKSAYLQQYYYHHTNVCSQEHCY